MRNAITIALVLGLALAPGIALAELGLDGLANLIAAIAGWLLGIATTVFSLIFIFYGFKLAGSGGNPAARSSAISGMMWSGIGALIAFGAFGLANVFDDIADEFLDGGTESGVEE